MTIGVDQNDQMPSLRKNGGGGGGIPNKDIIMARNMGFPNMKYLDPDSHGAPIQEKTLYKEFQQNKNNDIRLKREGFSNPGQDMANNTFIKLFQPNNNPD